MSLVEELERDVAAFNRLEGRSDFFTMAENIKDDHLMEAVVIILGTWNFAVFRYHVKDFDIEATRQVILTMAKAVEHLRNASIATVDLATHGNTISDAFDSLSAIKGIQYTGASKILHLLNKNLFVMWDGYIRGEKPKKAYRANKVEIKAYGSDGGSYVKFLADMQTKYQGVEWNGDMTLARAIDAHNYVSITLPMQDYEKKRRKKKKHENGNES